MKPQSLSAGERLRILIGHRVELLGAAGWVAVSFAGVQVLRLCTNVVLAWILAPELLGTMLIINTLRTGGELLTDVGIGQNIVTNRRGNEPAFYNTAWTIQILRGLLLFALALAATLPVSRLYENVQLQALLPISATIFVITGFTSPARFLLQKNMEVRTLVLLDLGGSAFSTVVHIGLALYSPTIWALIWGLLIGTAGPALASFFLMDWRSVRLQFERPAAVSIIHFGKWIFVSSLIYFLAMNFDRLYFADMIPLATLGIYGIARNFSDTAMQLFQRIGSLLIFPKISSLSERGGDLRSKIAPVRIAALVAGAVALAMGVAVADRFIDLLYDDRYRAAGLYLTVLLLGSWFAILATMAESMLFGVGKPASVAAGNAVKLALIAAGLPLFLTRYGMVAALITFFVAEFLRYVVLTVRKRSVGLAFLRQDLIATLLFFGLVLLFREVTMLFGLTSGIGGWLAQAEMLSG